MQAKGTNFNCSCLGKQDFRASGMNGLRIFKMSLAYQRLVWWLMGCMHTNGMGSHMELIHMTECGLRTSQT